MTFRIPASAQLPTDRETFYRELTTRHQHFVPAEVQVKLRKLKVLVAGCGSTGGACVESLARLGVEHFALADNGAYELNNLNRQHAFLQNIGQNKAEFHAECVKGINPFAEVIVHNEGINLKNVEPLVSWADIVIDAVDVTNPTSIAMKINLHVHAKEKGRPTFTALDVGFCQWGRSYDYRDPSTVLLGGAYEAARKAKHPMKALFSIVPLSAVPTHCLGLVQDLILDPKVSASQLGATSDLLSSIIVAAMIRFADNGELVAGWNFNTEKLALPWAKRFQLWTQSFRLRREVARLLDQTP